MHLYFTRGSLEQFSAHNARATENGDDDGGGGTGGGAGGSGPPLGDLSVMARRVYQVLKSEPQNNEGLHVQVIAAKLRASVPEVMKGGEELSEKSMIFPTVDEQTWALLEF